MSYRGNQCEAGNDPRFVHHGCDGGLRCKLFRRDLHEIIDHFDGARVKFSVVGEGSKGGIRVLIK